MKIRYKQKIKNPYSLHDMVVRRITIKKECVYLEFCHGYVSTNPPYQQIDGKVIIESVDFDSACVLFLSELGKYGEFNGKKISLKEFVKEYDDFCFEILDELYGYNQVEYIGYIRSPKIDELTQMSLSLYFSGDIVYETDE